MANVKLEWSQATFVDSFKIYRSNATMNPSSMPAPLATGVSETYYFDTTIVVDQTYFYRVGAVRGEQELISSEVEVLAGAPIVNDPYWANVQFLVFGDATVFPSTTFTDRSSFARAVTVGGSVSIVGPEVIMPLYDAGSIYFDGATGTADRIGVSSAAAPGTSDFTMESFIQLPSVTNNPFSARIFDMNSIKLIVPSTNYNQFQFLIGATDYGTFSHGVANDTWFHLCLMRKAGVAYVFVNGVLKASAAYASSLTSAIYFGGGPSDAKTFKGYMNCCRLTNVARYSETGFTPPDSKFPTS